MIAPATEAELAVARRMRSRSMLVMHGRRFVKHVAPGEAFVESNRLEALGLIEQWPQENGATLWRATDQPPSFERPHWRCESRPTHFSTRELYTLIVDVEPGHPELHVLVYTPTGAAPDLLHGALDDAIWHAREQIAEAIALRAGGDPCKCGACE